MKFAVAGGIGAVALAVLVSLYAGARTRGQEAHCRNNLRHLGGLASRNWGAIDPGRTGRDFWQAVREAQYKDIRGNWLPIPAGDPFVCPVRGTTVTQLDSKETIDYRGPVQIREFLKDMPKGSPIGADRAGNHRSGGFVLRFDTSVDNALIKIDRVKDDDAVWKAAESGLKD